MRRAHINKKKLNHDLALQRSKHFSLACICFLILPLERFYPNGYRALGKTSIANKRPSIERSGIVGKSKRSIQRNTCLISVVSRDLNEGELAEVLDTEKNRVAVVQLVRLGRDRGRLAAKVLVGEEKCDELKGYKILPLSTPKQEKQSIFQTSKDFIVSISAQFVLNQSALPGLALNKFLSPGYTQRGFGARTSIALPRAPKKLGKMGFQISSGGIFSSTITSPSIDIIKDGQTLGTQTFSSQLMHVRLGARLLYSDSRLWTELGAIALDKLSSTSAIKKSNPDVDVLFRAVRDVSGQSFGAYLEQGIVIGENTRLSMSGGIGLGIKYKTPIVEDADATNTSENFEPVGQQFFAGISLHLPIWRGFFSDMNFDYSNVNLNLPLVNDQQSKSAIEKLSFSLGSGYKF